MVARAGRGDREDTLGETGRVSGEEGTPGSVVCRELSPCCVPQLHRGHHRASLRPTRRDSGGVFTATLQMRKRTLGRLGNLPAGVM